MDVGRLPSVHGRSSTVRPVDGSWPAGSPALAALVSAGGTLPRRVLTATLVDLADHGCVLLTSVDGDPWVCAPVGNGPLSGYRRLVFEHLCRRSRGAPVPLSACAVVEGDATGPLWRAIEADVYAQARALGAVGPRRRRLRHGRVAAASWSVADAGALGTAFEASDRSSVWSDVTGTWRRVSVHIPDREGYFEPRLAVVARALAVAAGTFFLGFVLWAWSGLVHIGGFPLAWFVLPVTLPASFLACAWLFRHTWPLAVDFLRRPVSTVATVVYTEYVPGDGDSSPHHYVAVDDATGEDLPLWDVGPRALRRVQRGSTVRLTRTPRRYGLWRLRPVPPAPARNATPAP
jgi:hypothetical protein